MEYLYVTTDSDIRRKNKELTRSIGRITDSFLYSLIEGIRKNDFGCRTITETARNIKKCKSEYFKEGHSFVDSGGYSILTGVVEPNKIPAVIDCYCYYAEQEIDHYSYLFSLDIPYSNKYPALNKKNVIFDLNKKALQKLCRIVEGYPSLRDKLYFVWQFKVMEQYDVWCRLYEELRLSKYVNNYAVGGMVGLHEKAKVKFSPFTAISYRCLLDYIKAEHFKNDFRLHFLGMYIPYDRFHIAFLEKLFAHYLEGIAGVVMSYDSINYAHAARMNSVKPFFHYEDGKLNIFDKVTDVPAEIIDYIYYDYDIIYTEIERYKCIETNLLNASSFVPLRIYSNMCLDRFFEYIVDYYELIDLVVTAKSQTTFMGQIHIINKDIKQRWPDVFTRETCRSITENMDITFRYHRWFIDSLDCNSLDYLIRLFIDRINYPR